MQKFKIQEVAEELKVHPHKIRVLEYNGIIETERQTGKDRLFVKKDITKLKKIFYALEHGFNIFSLKIALQIASIDKINKLIDADKKDNAE